MRSVCWFLLIVALAVGAEGCGARAGSGEDCFGEDGFCEGGICMDLSLFSSACTQTVCSRVCQTDLDCQFNDSPKRFRWRCQEEPDGARSVCVPTDMPCVAEGQ